MCWQSPSCVSAWRSDTKRPPHLWGRAMGWDRWRSVGESRLCPQCMDIRQPFVSESGLANLLCGGPDSRYLGFAGHRASHNDSHTFVFNCSETCWICCLTHFGAKILSRFWLVGWYSLRLPERINNELLLMGKICSVLLTLGTHHAFP